MYMMVLKNNSWLMTYVAVFGLFFGAGMQMKNWPNFFVSSSQAVEKENLLCADGSSLKLHLQRNQKTFLGQITEFGAQARTTWKKCVCTGFISQECQALEMEISDETQLSQLDNF